jgi:hypothetical protein
MRACDTSVIVLPPRIVAIQSCVMALGTLADAE